MMVKTLLFPAVRALPLAAALGLGLLSGASQAATPLSIQLTVDSVSHTCNLSAFSISNAGSVSATILGCDPALGSGTGSPTPSEPPPSPPPPPPPEQPSGDGGVGGTDPRVGTWSPNLSAVPRVVVVSQAGKGGETVTVVPGCVNGGAAGVDAPCSTASVYNATINGVSVPVRLTKGQILSVRYPLSGTAATGSTGSIKLTNAWGGAISQNTKISLSPRAGDMTGNGLSRCTNLTNLTPAVSTGTTSFSCKIDRAQPMYYLNIAVQDECSGSNCIFYVQEGSLEFR